MSVTTLPVLLVIGILLVRFPLALALLTMFLPLEAPGVGAAVVAFRPSWVPLIYVGYFLAVFRVFYDLWCRRNLSLVSHRIFLVALLAMGTSAWMGVSMLLNDSGIVNTVSMSLGAIPGALFALAYYNHRSARILLILVVVIHLIIGCGVIAFPNSPLAV